MSGLRRRDLVVLALLALAIVGVFVAAAVVLRRERAALITDLERQQKAELADAARRFAEELDDIADDVRFASGLVSRSQGTADIERELNAMLEVVGQYRAVAVYDADGAHRLTIYDRQATPGLRADPFSRALEDAAHAAADRPGRLVTSLPIARSATGEFRIFAHCPGAGAQAVSVLVDMGPLFGPFEVVSASEDTKLVLLGAHKNPTAPSDPAVLEALARGAPEAVNGVLQRMADGGEGCTLLAPEDAARIGLASADALACYLAIPVDNGEHWSAATFTSARALETSDRRLLIRLLAATVAAIALLALLGAYGLLAARRALELRESRRLAEHLDQLHQRTRRMLDHLPAGVLALGESGRVTFANRLMQERTGGLAQESTLEAVFSRATPDALGRLRTLLERAAASNEPASLYGERIHLFGEEGDYNLHAVPVGPADPGIRTLLVLEDISQLRSLETQLVRAEKLATTGVLAAGIAHEIGTPLGVVRGRAEYVGGKLGPGHPQAAGLQVIVEQIDRVSRTLRQLLDFARVQPAARRPVQVTQSLETIRELLTVEAEHRQLRFSVEAAPGLRVAADPDQLQQVLVNLALNAFDACRPGGAVKLRATADSPRTIAFEVSDDGVGIPAEHRARVFDPFFTTKKRGMGTGLGLAVVAQVVRNHGGEIDLDSEEQRGTVVTVRWPAAPAEEAARATL